MEESQRNPLEIISHYTELFMVEFKSKTKRELTEIMVDAFSKRHPTKDTIDLKEEARRRAAHTIYMGKVLMQ